MSQYSLDNTIKGPGQSAEQIATWQTDLLCRLMEGIGQHAVEEDPEELARFQERVAEETQHLKAAADQGQMKLAVETFIELVTQHNDAVSADNRAHAAELTKAMRMMAETIGQISKSSQAAVHQLAVIEKSLEDATATNDVSRIRMKLGVCLKMIREQSESLKAQSEEQVSQLKVFVASYAFGQQAALLEDPLDEVTGLPARAFADNLISERLAQKTDCLVGVVTVNRLNGFQNRFGQAATDDVMKTVARQLAQKLPAATTLCRWSQNSFIAVTDITSSYAETAQQWRKVGGIKVEKSIDDHSRTAFVALNTSVMVEHLRAMSSKRGLIYNLDRFVMQQSGEMAA